MEIFDALIQDDKIVYTKLKNLDIDKIKQLNCGDEVVIDNEKYFILKKDNYIIIDKFECLDKKFDSLKQQALFDGLTGCYTKKETELMLKKLITNAIRYKHSLSIVSFDIDFFKKINDTYGHLAGDYVLKELSSIALQQIREGDICGRMGGEEFFIILPNTKLSGALKLAERLRQIIQKHDFIYNNEKIEVTISIGITSLSSNDDFDSLYKRVDEALYLAKSKGRNRVEYK